MSNSNPSLPPPASSVPPPMAAPTSSSSPLRRRGRDPDDGDAPDQEGELRDRFPVRRHASSSSDTDDDDGRQPRVEHDDYNPNGHGGFPSRLRRRLDALEILGLFGACAGAGAALPPSPTSSGECESDATISDDDDYHHGLSGGGGGGGEGGFNLIGSSSSAGTSSAAVDRGWAATRKRGWKAGPGGNKMAVLSDSDDSDLNTVSADGQADTTSITIAQAAAPAALHHHQPPPPHVPKQLQEAHPHPPHAPHPPPPADPPRRRERQREYTCKECGKSYPTNQALGGHAAGHKNKKREAEAMAAAMAAAAAGGAGGEGGGASATLDAAFLLALRRGGGKEDKPHECRQCGKVFGSGVALGGHMRVHYTGPPIVPARKNKKRCLAPLPPDPMPAEGDIAAATAELGLSLALSSIKADENIAVAAPRPVPPVVAAVGLSLRLSIKAEEEVPSTPPSAETAGGGDVRVVRLFGMDISPPQVQQAPLLQQQRCSGDTTEDSSSIGEEQQH